VKILLDECIDRRLTKALKGHAVRTVPQMGWATIKNGRLLALAEKEFDVFVTVDRNLSFQQHPPKFDIAVLVLSAASNRLADLLPLAPKMLASFPNLKPGQATTIKGWEKYRAAEKPNPRTKGGLRPANSC
jgi:predicted nuclease of predicted toxin-antitoxin system